MYPFGVTVSVPLDKNLSELQVEPKYQLDISCWLNTTLAKKRSVIKNDMFARLFITYNDSLLTNCNAGKIGPNSNLGRGDQKIQCECESECVCYTKNDSFAAKWGSEATNHSFKSLCIYVPMRLKN